MTSSKNNIDLLVRIGVLEKLTDALSTRIQDMEKSLMKIDLKNEGVGIGIGNHTSPQYGAASDNDDWEPGQTTEELEKDPKKKILPGDEVNTLLNN